MLLDQLFCCVELQTLFVFRSFFVLLAGHFILRSADIGLLSALGNSHVIGREWRGRGVAPMPHSCWCCRCSQRASHARLSPSSVQFERWSHRFFYTYNLLPLFFVLLSVLPDPM